MNYRLIRMLLVLIMMLSFAACFVACDTPDISLPNATDGKDKDETDKGIQDSADGTSDKDDNNSGLAAHVHKYVSVEVPPTCTDSGYCKYTCSCGETYAANYVPSLGHDYTSSQYVVENGKTLCKDGGILLSVCGTCKYVNSEKVEPAGHSVSKWAVLLLPTVEAEGTVYGSCDECEEVAVVSLPPLSNKDYIYKEKLTVQICTSKVGIGIYTVYLEKSGKLTLNDENSVQSVSVEIDVSGSFNHVLNGNEMTEAVYDSALPGIVEFTNAQSTCAQNGKGYYKCDACSEFISVATTSAHTYGKYTVQVLTEPTCTKAGVAKDYCTVCTKYITYDVAALGHKFTTEFISETNSVLAFYIECSECEYAKTETVNKYKKATKAPSCIEEGSLTYSFEYENADVLVVLKTEKISHTLDGVPMDLSLVYDVNEPGIKEFATDKATCQSNGKGYFVCDMCEAYQMVHTSREHSGTLIVSKAPTCDVSGTGIIKCNTCSKDINSEIPPAGHKYESKLVSEDGGVINIEITCSSCKISKNITSSNYKKTVTEPTCKEDGLVVYTVTKDGETVVHKEIIPKYKHTLNGVEMDLDKNYAVVDGIVEFKDYEATETKLGKGYFICDKCGDIQIVVTEIK